MLKKNLTNIEKANGIYRISTEKLYIKNLKINNDVATIIIIYDVYDDSILNYRIYVEEIKEEHYLMLIRDTIIKNRVEDYLVIPDNIFIDNFKMGDKEKFFKILKELKININGSLEKNREITKFVRFLEKDIINIFKGESLSIKYLNYNLEKYICNGLLKNISKSNKLFDLNKLDFLFESADRKVQNYGIRFKNNLYGDGILKPYIGKIVTLRYSPFDLNVLKVYLEDKFLFPIYLIDVLI